MCSFFLCVFVSFVLVVAPFFPVHLHRLVCVLFASTFSRYTVAVDGKRLQKK